MWYQTDCFMLCMTDAGMYLRYTGDSRLSCWLGVHIYDLWWVGEAGPWVAVHSMRWSFIMAMRPCHATHAIRCTAPFQYQLGKGFAGCRLTVICFRVLLCQVTKFCERGTANLTQTQVTVWLGMAQCGRSVNEGGDMQYTIMGLAVLWPHNYLLLQLGLCINAVPHISITYANCKYYFVLSRCAVASHRHSWQSS